MPHNPISFDPPILSADKKTAVVPVMFRTLDEANQFVSFLVAYRKCMQSHALAEKDLVENGDPEWVCPEVKIS